MKPREDSWSVGVSAWQLVPYAISSAFSIAVGSGCLLVIRSWSGGPRVLLGVVAVLLTALGVSVAIVIFGSLRRKGAVVCVSRQGLIDRRWWPREVAWGEVVRLSVDGHGFLGVHLGKPSNIKMPKRALLVRRVNARLGFGDLWISTLELPVTAAELLAIAECFRARAAGHLGLEQEAGFE